MPTKAQNEVYEKYGLRKGEVWQLLSEVRDILTSGFYHACNAFMTRADTARMHLAIASLLHLSKVWRAYQECDKDA